MEKQLFAIGIIFILGLAFIAVSPRTPVIKTDALQKFASYDELKNFVKASVENAGYGTDYYNTMDRETSNGLAAPMAADVKSTPEYSRTNVQVEGVDEADIVKNDDKYIYFASGNKVVIVDAYPAENAKIISEINMNSSIRGIFVNGDKLIAFGDEYYNYPMPMEMDTVAPESKISARPVYYQPNSFIRIYDISDRSKPVLARNITTSGSYFDSRMIGNYVYALTNEHVYGDNVPLPLVMRDGIAVKSFPDIYYFPIPDRSYNYVNIIAINLDGGEVSAKTYMMPYSQTTYVSKNNIYLTYQKWLGYSDFFDKILDEVIIPSVPFLKPKIAEIKGYNISSGSKLNEIQVALQDYMNSLTSEERNSMEKSMQERIIPVQREIDKERQKTYISKISISGKEINYEGQGAVPGSLLNQFSMDEYNGYFRIATTTNNNYGFVQPMGIAARDAVPVPSVPTTTNNIYVLDSNMKTVGKIEGIAPGESIYSVRFMGNRAYMVTFKHVDPLFVIDLSNPSSPLILGKLSIPGYSDYLHPYDETHLIGIGHEVDESIDANKVHSSDAVYYTAIQGVKISLFDVSDVSNPVEMHKAVIGDRGTTSLATTDHKAFLFDKNKQLLVIPVTVMERKQNQSKNVDGDFTFQGAYVYRINLQELTLKGRITHMNSTEIADMAMKGYWYGYGTEIQRSLYIGNTLYTLSNKMIKANSLDDLKEIKSVPLPYQNYYGGSVIY